ncbi:MAG: hypothetical protein KF726_10675 [Anaerolineae bacterium]|nr:hypothetical protein [Anaerolineae bacterium]
MTTKLCAIGLRFLVMAFCLIGMSALALPRLIAQSGTTLLAVYDPDPDHLWNRLFRQFYMRTAADDAIYGGNSPDPLLWFETTYLLTGESHAQALALLDEFLDTDGEQLVNDPLKRAIMQRDLWTIFDWLSLGSGSAVQPDNFAQARRELQQRIALIIHRLALSAEQIASLPDTYQQAINADVFPPAFQPDQPEAAYLPPDLFDPQSDWVQVGRLTKPTAGIHVQSEGFSGRSAFLVFMRLPGGNSAAKEHLAKVNSAEMVQQLPLVPSGTEVALVRQLLLIDDHGNLTSSEITESVQIRHISDVNLARREITQQDFEFQFERTRLFSSEAGGLVALSRDERQFPVFMTHGIDPFDHDQQLLEQYQIVTLQQCSACHSDFIQQTDSLHTFDQFGGSTALVDDFEPTTPAQEYMRVIDWKMTQENWKLLILLIHEAPAHDVN